jgi:hypothetical protein
LRGEITGVRGRQADRNSGEERTFCCVTTRGRNFGVRDSLGGDFGSLPAVLLGQGMLRFHTGILTMVSLADENRDAPRLH